MEAQKNSVMSAGDVVIVVIALVFEKGKLDIIEENSIYFSFQKMAEEFPSYFKGLHFRIIGEGFPHSGELEDILFRAGSSGCLNRTGWRQSSFRMEGRTIELEKVMFKKYYGEEELKKINELADRFIQLIKESEHRKE